MANQSGMLSKTLVIGIIILFIGIAVQPSVAIVQPEEEITAEQKDFLFQTIIDIANNPDVKELLEQYNHKLLTSDYDYKGVFSQLLFKKPRLLFNVLFTKPSITYEYLDKSYNRGIEVTNILGEEKSLEIIETIEITDTEVLEEFNNIIINNEELSGRLAILKEMNKELKNGQYFWDYPIVCTILLIFFVVLLLQEYIVEIIANSILNIFEGTVVYNLIYPILALFVYTFIFLFITVGSIIFNLGCLEITSH